MARPLKQGLSYFPLDVDFFEDDRIQLVEAEFGHKGVYTAIRLLCKIYKEGYYYQWGEDQCLLLSRQMGADFRPSAVDEIVLGLVRRSLFDKGVYDSFHVLTSKAIQERYAAAIRACRREPDIRPEYCLIDVSAVKTVVFTGKTKVFAKETTLNKIKENKIKGEGEESAHAHAGEPSPSNDVFLKKIRDDDMKIEAIAMNARIPKSEVLSKTGEYDRWLSITERRFLTYGEYCRTFVSWINIEKKQKSNGNGTGNRAGHEEIDISANRPEDYEGRF